MAFRDLVQRNRVELASMVASESGKSLRDADADVAKGLESIDWACALPHIACGRHATVSDGVTCHEVREPLGIVACVTPFNFPFMVPMWTAPVAIAAGNCVLMKPSEKTPATMLRAAELMDEAGLPPNVLQVIEGGKSLVGHLCDHPGIAALSFVGSSQVARTVHARAVATGKRAVALGGANNYLLAMPDCDIEATARDVVSSFTGCAGQRCMSASVLLVVGEQAQLVAAIVDASRKAEGIGTMIDVEAATHICGQVNDAERGGARLLLDGRADGVRCRPTILEFPRAMAVHDTFRGEVFGPVLKIMQVDSCREALALENLDDHGNGACVYTRSGALAEFCARQFRAGMVGINVGIPVPRDPFCFGGHDGTDSKFGTHDINGQGALDLVTRTKKITSRWQSASGDDPAQF